MDMLGNTIMMVIIVGVVVWIGLIAMVAKWYKKSLQGQALVRSGIGGTVVSFNGKLVMPILHQLERLDISLKIIEVDMSGIEKVISKDDKSLGIKVIFYVRINKTEEDVMQVAQTMGCERTFNQEEVEKLFYPKFAEAIKTVANKFDGADLYKKRDSFRMELLNYIGTDLNGYCLDDAAVDYIERLT